MVENIHRLGEVRGTGRLQLHPKYVKDSPACVLEEGTEGRNKVLVARLLHVGSPE